MMTDMTFRKAYRLSMVILLAVLILGSSDLPPGDTVGRARAFTRPVEFDYVSWTLNALGVKLSQLALGTSKYISPENESQVVLDYLDLLRNIQQAESQLNDIYTDPNIDDPEVSSSALREEIDALLDHRERLEPLAESVLQDQLSSIAAELGISLGGQPIPPILFRTTPPPDALIISPRNVIQQDANISIRPDLTVDQHAELEGQVDQALDVSSLVVGIGGIGIYPTMVMQTTDINWLAEVVAHEWVHNFLTLRPLGVSYLSGAELRTMNETTAAIAGKEIGRLLIERYYPEFLPPPPPPEEPGGEEPGDEPDDPPPPPVFDFRAEMRETRVNADRLLEEGKVEEAETYMELRRRFFWDHGYHIRKLNQAYFAFYGAYADQPGGAAGEDPVGAAVRAMRAHSSSLVEFLNRISLMWSYEQLQREVGEV
jgi:hypothetical protein